MSYLSEVLTDSPVLLALMKEPSGTTVIDSSTVANDGALTGSGVTVGAAGLLGDGSTAYDFGVGNSGIVSFGTKVAYNGNGGTNVFGWFKTSTSGLMSLLLADIGGSHRWFHVRLNNGQLEFLMFDNNEALTLDSLSTGTFNDGLPHFFMFTTDGASAWALYVDGALNKSGTGTYTPVQTGNQGLFLGQRLGGSQFVGTMCGMGLVVGQQLSLARAQAYYAAGIAVPSGGGSGVTDLADATAAATAGYTKTQGIALKDMGVEYWTEYSKRLVPAVGQSFVFSARGVAPTAAAADVVALASLNAKRRHRYAGSPGAPSGSAAVSTLHGDLLVPDVS